MQVLKVDMWLECPAKLRDFFAAAREADDALAAQAEVES